MLVLTACRSPQEPQPVSHIAEVVETLHEGYAMHERAGALIESKRTEQDRQKPTWTGARRKVLLVDDSSTVLLIERTLLSRNNYEVITARDGQEGVEKALAEKPDLILMDVVMPRMDGHEAVKRIRSEQATRDIPVIMVTTRGEMKNVETGYESGCSEYVTKPFSGLELLAKVKSCLGE